MMRKKMNNKGFSLVELIVVIAIMAILAVTLAPRLMRYIDKARVASDEQAINAIFDATRLALTDDDYFQAIKDDTTNVVKINGTLADDTTLTYYVCKLRSFYTYASGAWSPNPTIADDGLKEIATSLGKFELKSKIAKDVTDILLCYNVKTDELTVLLDYTGTATYSTAGTAAADFKTNVLDVHDYVISQ